MLILPINIKPQLNPTTFVGFEKVDLESTPKEIVVYEKNNQLSTSWCLCGKKKNISVVLTFWGTVIPFGNVNCELLKMLPVTQHYPTKLWDIIFMKIWFFVITVMLFN